MRIVINQGQRTLDGQQAPTTVAVFSLVEDVEGRTEMVFGGSMTKADYEAMIVELTDRKGDVWSS
jgi:hypothetical protein